MLAGVLAGQAFTSVLAGDNSLSSRPMSRVIEPLEKMGARIVSREGKPPLTITGANQLEPISYEPSVASAQVKSCILFAGMQTDGRTVILERQPTRDHTERLLNCFGVPVESNRTNDGVVEISVSGPRTPQARGLTIPGDPSSAAFFIAAAALLPDSELEITGVGLNPSRIEFVSLCQSLGFDVTVVPDKEECNEPVGSILIRGGIPLSTQVSQSIPERLIPSLIDELPLLAIVGTRISGGISIRGAKELRFKESDRIVSTVKNLRRMGATVEEFPDGLQLPGPQELRGARLESFGDHRIAMAFSVAALFAHGESVIEGSECVSISFPEFYQQLDSVLKRT
jgi:3-phosphoshikimate 1-carboxyvinyltransferase